MSEINNQPMTYRSFIDQMSRSRMPLEERASNILAAQMMMKDANPSDPVDAESIRQMQEKLKKQPAFQELLKDPRARAMTNRGQGDQLVIALADKQNERMADLSKYERLPGSARGDARLLDNALRSLEDNSAGKSPLEIERKSKRFYEMVKRMDHAKTLSQQGISLSGEETKKLIDSVKNYVDGGKGMAGGAKEAAAFKESMCVLKHFMPEQEFNQYCAEMTQNRQIQQPSRHRKVDPASFEPERLTGEAMTAREFYARAKHDLNKGLTMDSLSTIAAIHELSKGNPEALIRKEDLAAKKSDLMANGSSFRRTMNDEIARAKFASLASQGKVRTLGAATVKAAKEHSIRTAQWHLNRSAAALVKGASGSQATENLAYVLAARDIAQNASAGSHITNKDFKDKARQFQRDPSFVALSTRFNQDASFRQRITDGLSRDSSAMGLQLAYSEVKNPNLGRNFQSQIQVRDPNQLQMNQAYNDYYSTPLPDRTYQQNWQG
ncbi:MAG: hypothetical protein J6P72_09510 [Firmicutes bacterium]|nr:hypothetical protein [Bacillota bacterium]